MEYKIVAHRGTHGGNIIENTLESAMLAKKSGADIVETDLCRSTDGVYYCFHDGREEVLFGGGPPLYERSSEEIDRSEYIGATGGRSGKYPDRFFDVLDRLPEDLYLHLDRSRLYWKDGFLERLAKHPAAERITVKSPVEETGWLEAAARVPKISYMPIVKTKDEVKKALKYTKPSVLEIIAASEEDELWDKELLKELKNNGPELMINLEVLGDGRVLGAGFDDESLLKDPERFNDLIEMGFTLFQTDYPWLYSSR